MRESDLIVESSPSDALNRDAPQVWELCARTQTEGTGVSLSWQTSQKPLVQGLEYTCPTLMVTTKLQELIAYVPYLCHDSLQIQNPCFLPVNMSYDVFIQIQVLQLIY